MIVDLMQGQVFHNTLLFDLSPNYVYVLTTWWLPNLIILNISLTEPRSSFQNSFNYIMIIARLLNPELISGR